MDRKKPSEFKKFCRADITKLHREIDPAKRLHFLRRINAQMIAEASNQNVDDDTVCKMMSDDLDVYVEKSASVYHKKIDELMGQLKIDMTVSSIKTKIDTANFARNKKKCQNVCKNDVLTNDLDKFFNVMKTRNTPNTSDAQFNPSGSSNNHCNDPTFNTNAIQHFAANSSRPLHTAAFGHNSNNYPNNENRAVSPNRHNRSFDNNTANKYNPLFNLKRKLSLDGNDIAKRPNVQPNPEPEARNHFITASEKLTIDYNQKHGGQQNDNFAYNTNPSGGQRRSLGGRRTINNKFVPPYANQENTPNTTSAEEQNIEGIDLGHPRLKNVDPKMIEAIQNEIIDQGDTVEWDSIAGLEYAKKILQEAVVLPILRPDIFTGLRQPPRGVLLFGPPGTGKTLIGKCIASQSGSTFFSISASSLTSKWIGEGEKMVRALFAVAAARQPSVVFIDEIDSLLCQRSESEHESSRRIKTEFLVQLDGASTTERERILIVGATNRPQELDEAARRRFVKRLYIPLPEAQARKDLLSTLLSKENHSITPSQFGEIAGATHGYSGADMKILCQEAGMGPVRSISFSDMKNISASSVRPLIFNDFQNALSCVRASVSQDDLQQYVDWNNKYGSGSGR